jgi:hypothetical protein
VIAIGSIADDPRSAGFDLGDFLIDRKIAIAGVDAIITRQNLIGFLELANLIEIFGRAEIRIGSAPNGSTL